MPGRTGARGRRTRRPATRRSSTRRSGVAPALARLLAGGDGQRVLGLATNARRRSFGVRATKGSAAAPAASVAGRRIGMWSGAWLGAPLVRWADEGSHTTKRHPAYARATRPRAEGADGSQSLRP
eukprot:scaffold2943_cov379-Prasinococcus_capsulatus_cf.AAC.6